MPAQRSDQSGHLVDCGINCKFLFKRNLLGKIDEIYITPRKNSASPNFEAVSYILRIILWFLLGLDKRPRSKIMITSSVILGWEILDVIIWNEFNLAAQWGREIRIISKLHHQKRHRPTAHWKLVRQEWPSSAAHCHKVKLRHQPWKTTVKSAKGGR